MKAPSQTNLNKMYRKKKKKGEKKRKKFTDEIISVTDVKYL